MYVCVCVCVCQVPHCLVALQRSVYAVLIGRTQAPDWLTHGIPQLARTASAVVSLVDTRWPAAAETFGTSVASDGRFLYVHDPHYGLLKIGCGYGNTIMVRCTCFTYLCTVSDAVCDVVASHLQTCQPFRFWRNSSAFPCFFCHSGRNYGNSAFSMNSCERRIK